MTERSQYVSLAQLPNDDRTLRQAKSLIRYQHPGARDVKAHWCDPTSKDAGITATWKEGR